MAPVKESMDQKRGLWIQSVCAFLENGQVSPNTLDSISEVKGLFNRVVKQNQWDWFVVFDRLGRPRCKKSREIVNDLSLLRGSVTKNDLALRATSIDKLTCNDILRHLELYVSGEEGITVGHHTAGQIYILSTREQRDVIKIGYTNKSIYNRVRQINSATGVMIPYGVRAIWLVKDAPEMEKEIHSLLHHYRVRHDREFFNVDFYVARNEIMNHLKKQPGREW